jgi:hypothetical protein
MFEERSAQTGVRQASLPFTGFGAAWIDIDNDGWLDVLSVNGDVNRNAKDLSRKNDPFPLGQRKLVLRNRDGHFEDATEAAGPVFRVEEASRGAAFGDIDNDGDVDVLVGNGAGRTRLLLNNIGNRNHWLGLRLVGQRSPSSPRAPAEGGPVSPPKPPGEGGRDMVGARVAIIRPHTPTLWRRSRADGSYASANDPRVLVGLGASVEQPRVQVIWPDGKTEEWPGVAIDRYTTLVEGSAR